MILDFRDADVALDVDCDVCIVGAGAAGITLALALTATGRRVVVLESGGTEYEAEVQSLYEGRGVGLENASPTACRLRYLGGTTNHWAGWCAPLQDVDFEQRPWVTDSAWPLTRVELQPYYDRAQVLCELKPTLDGSDSLDRYEPDLPKFEPARARISFFRYSPPTRFGTVYRDQLAAAPGIELYLHANLVEFETNETASVIRSVRATTLDGKTGAVRARIFVLACGGMENARMLLASNQVQAEGLGNDSDLVGRYFMQHIERDVARIMATDVDRLLGYFARRRTDDSDYRPEIVISREAQQQYRTLNAGFTIRRGLDRSEGVKALEKIWKDVRNGQWPDAFSRRLGAVLSDLGSVGGAMFGGDEPFANLYVRAESWPNPESRITLGDEVDRLGMRKIRVDWRLTAFDKRSIRESTRLVAEELGRLEMGRIELADWLVDEDDEVWPQPIWSGCHHMGTTRMSESPAEGVVNSDCRTHSVANLYIAGSSVFPTGGYVPPTLTIVAMSLRLAEQLEKQLSKEHG